MGIARPVSDIDICRRYRPTFREEEVNGGKRERFAAARAERQGDVSGTITQLHEDVGKVDDPRAQALFETTVEVLSGLVKACEHYESGAEEAWRD